MQQPRECWDCGAVSITEVAEKPAPVVDVAPRCWRCNRLLINSATRPWEATCIRCKAQNKSA